MKIFVVIPTWNESMNIGRLLEKISALKIKGLEALVVDDDSPDGTWKIVEKISEKNPSIHILHRKNNRGRGIAGKAGFEYALAHGADYIIEMDADFSHPPEMIPKLLEEAKKYDVVIASRGIVGGKDFDRNIVRTLITIFANLFHRIILGIKVKDVNSGFRCFRRSALEPIVKNLQAKNCNIVQEVLYKCCLNKCSVKEIPFTFLDRGAGKSSKIIRDYIEVPFFVVKLRLLHLLGKF